MNTRRYREVRAAVVRALETGNYRHETRVGKVDEKNLLQAGLVQEDFVIKAIQSCPAGRARRSDHHFLDGVDVWTIDPTINERPGVKRPWYIKFYCLAEDDTWFLSVHPADLRAGDPPAPPPTPEGKSPP